MDIRQEYFDDGYCDCSTCEDEQYWGCSNCTSAGCVTTCCEWSYCDGTDAGCTTDGTGSGHDCFQCEIDAKIGNNPLIVWVFTKSSVILS